MQKSIFRALTTFLFSLVVTSQAATAQSAFLDKGKNGKGVEIRAGLSGLSFEEFEGVSVDLVGITAGYAIEGLIEMGLDLNTNLGSIQKTGEDIIDVALLLSVPVLIQDDRIPLSCRINGSYGRSGYFSDALENNGLSKNGTAVSIGADIYTRVQFIASTSFVIGVEGMYEFHTIVTETSADSYSTVEKESMLRFGVIAGIALQSKDGIAFSLNAKILFDENLQMFVVPLISVVAMDL